jgi:hypothetical protein
MRLIKHLPKPDSGKPIVYSIVNISITDLGSLQLALIMAGQTELRTSEDWVHTPLPVLEKETKVGKHEQKVDARKIRQDIADIKRSDSDA